jgi:hypothetical protein
MRDLSRSCLTVLWVRLQEFSIVPGGWEKGTTMASQFDALSKALAGGVSRREVLRGVGAGLTGALLASMGVRKASAAPSDCAVLCGKTAFTSGPAHASCIQACHQCGGDISRICQTPTGSICCPSGQVCSPATNQCVAPCTCESLTACGSGGCLCVQTTEGASACITPICTGQPCTTSAECGPGSVCFVSGATCCGGGSFCIPLCA